MYIGLDLGTSSLKGVALDGSGGLVASEREGYDTARPAAGRAEQDPGDWMAAARAVLSRLAAAVPPASWRGIGLSGMIPTLVTLDEAGEPTGPAITWEDSRAHKEAEEIVWQAGAAEIYELTGQPLDGRYLLPMAAWLARHDPDRIARTTVVLGAKDYLFFKLTGHFLTDPSTATGYGCYGLAGSGWAAPVTAVAGVSAATGRPGRPGLPPVVPSADTRPLLPAVAEQFGLPAGLKVSVGAADSVLAAEALGAVQPGTVAYVWGTSTVILGAASTLTLDPERRCLITPLAVMGWGVEMDLVSTGAAVAWLSRLLGFGESGQAEVVAAAAAARDDTVPLALPFVGGGRAGRAVGRGRARHRPRAGPLARAGRRGPGRARRHHPGEPPLPGAPARPRPAARRGAGGVGRRGPLAVPAPRRRRRPPGARRRSGCGVVGRGCGAPRGAGLGPGAAARRGRTDREVLGRLRPFYRAWPPRSREW